MIEDVRTGRRITTSVVPVVADDLLSLGRGWRFEWIEEVKVAEVYKLTAPLESDRVLGLIALIRCGSYVQVTHLESNPNDVGRAKTFRGIAGSLIAFAAQLSFEIGGEGFLAMDVKTELVDHYRAAYGFERVGKSQRMILGTQAAVKLISTYGEGPIHE